MSLQIALFWYTIRCQYTLYYTWFLGVIMIKKNTCLYLALLLVSAFTQIAAIHAQTPVEQHVLENGLTILLLPVKNSQNVSTQIWYNVGSKDEAEDEKGLAHWLEHMCLKGTEHMSETDVWAIATKLSGSANASTTADVTSYYLDLPVDYAYEALPVLADMMCNCTFKQDLLNAELQVVVAELKNGRDEHWRQIYDLTNRLLFADHPYSYPVLGHMTDLAKLSREKLFSFYKKHYIPNNAVLIIVGDIDPVKTLEQVEKEFGHIKPNWAYTKQEHAFTEDICSRTATLYREVKNPRVALAFKTPCLKDSNIFGMDVLKDVLVGGTGSRLHQKLVDQLHLCTFIGDNSEFKSDAGSFSFAVELTDISNLPAIVTHINAELEAIAQDGITELEFEVSAQKLISRFYNVRESNQEHAKWIATSYLATGNTQLLFEYGKEEYAFINEYIKEFTKQYLRPSVMHTSMILPLPEQEKKAWQRLQEQSNAQDAQLLKDKKRKTEVEPGKYVHTLSTKEPKIQQIAQPQEFILKNGLKVISIHNDTVPKIEVTLKLKANGWYESIDKAGLYNLVTRLLKEGTSDLSKVELTQKLNTLGINLNCSPGKIDMRILHKHAAESFKLLSDIVQHPAFNQQDFDTVKDQALNAYHDFWDTPRNLIWQLMHEQRWGKHAINTFGTPTTLEALTLDDVKTFYADHFTPQETTLVVVGDLSGLDLQEFIKTNFGNWEGPKVKDLASITQRTVAGQEIDHIIEREQVILAFEGPSVDQKHKDYDALSLFNQSMWRKLFALRNQSGIAYWINGSVIHSAGKRPGTAYIMSQVSQTRCQEAEELFKETIGTLADSFTEDDLIIAQHAMINNINKQYATQRSTVDTLVTLNELELPFDYYAQRIEKIKTITAQEVRDATRQVLDVSKMNIFRVGPKIHKQADEHSN